MDAAPIVVLPPSVSKKALLAVLWTGTAVSILAVSARLLIRWTVLGKFKVDDYLVIIALCLSTAFTIIWTVLQNDLYTTLNLASEFQHPHDLQATLALWSITMHGNLASYICLWTSVWSIKLSFIAFFHKLGDQIRFQQILWWAILFFTIATYAVCVGMLDYGCLTSSTDNIMNICLSQKTVDYEYANTRVSTTFDILTDVLIIILSANIVWRAKIPWKKKLVLGSICSVTAAMIAISIIRVTVSSPGKTPDLSWLLLWNGVEMTLAIFVACVASFRNLYCQSKINSRPSKDVIHEPVKRVPRGLRALATLTAISTFTGGTLLDEEDAHWSHTELKETDELPLNSGAEAGIVSLENISTASHAYHAN